MSVVLAVDIGSSSVRCFAYLRDDSLSLEEQCRSLKRIAAGDEKAPGQPDAAGRFHSYILLSAANKAVTKCLEALRRMGRYHVAAIGFDCFAMSLIGTDETGHAATPVYSYAERGPTTGFYAQRLREILRARGDLEQAYQRTGTPVHAAYAAPTLLRLTKEEPEMLQHVHCWQTFTSFLLTTWTSMLRVPISYSEASWTGLLNRTTFDWDEGMLRAVGLKPYMIAPVCDYDAAITLQLSTEFARRWPELVGARLLLGFGDGAMANVGSKCVDTSRIAATVGTSAAMRIVVPSDKVPRIPCGLWCYSIDRKHSLLGGALTDGGSVYEWIAEAVGSKCATSLETEMDAPMPGAHGLTILPFLSGERSPGWNDAATGAICGITRHTTGQHIARAMLEAVALRMAAVGQLLAPHATLDAQVVASGTALTNSPAWRQMISDALGRELLIESVPEATSRGVAVMACRAVHAGSGGVGSTAAAQPLVAEALSEGVVSIHPSAERTVAFATALLAQQRVYRIMFGRSWLAPQSDRLQAVLLVGASISVITAALALGFAMCKSRPTPGS